MMIMNSTSARCVIAHSERLKFFMARVPYLGISGTLFCPSQPSQACEEGWEGMSLRSNRAHLHARLEGLHAERHHLIAVAQAAGDERRVLGERGDRDLAQRQRV